MDEENFPASSAAQPFEAGKEEEQIPAPPEAGPPPRSRLFLRRALRWAAGLLIVFALGALAATWFLYRPQTQELAAARAAQQQSQARIAELEGQVDRLQPLGETNETLQAQLEQAEARTQLLATLVEVNRARLALANENLPEAQEGLSGAGQGLTELARLVGPGEREQVAAMQSRLELVRGEIEQDAFAAQSDLGVIAANLEQLEETLFQAP
jgi:hypothetical protein